MEGEKSSSEKAMGEAVEFFKNWVWAIRGLHKARILVANSSRNSFKMPKDLKLDQPPLSQICMPSMDFRVT